MKASVSTVENVVGRFRNFAFIGRDFSERKPVISFVDMINRISSKCFVKSQSLSGRRGIFDGGYATNKGTDFDYMGENFIFVNRVTECKKLITRFGEMDLLRG